MKHLIILLIIITLSSCQTLEQDDENIKQQSNQNTSDIRPIITSSLPQKQRIGSMGEYKSPTSSYLFDRSFKRSGKTVCVYKSNASSDEEYFFILENFSIRCPMYRDL